MAISSPADRAKIKEVLKAISDSFTRIEAERDLIKESISELSSEHNISKKILNKMARIYHKQSYSKAQQEFEEFEEFYEGIVESKEG